MTHYRADPDHVNAIIVAIAVTPLTTPTDHTHKHTMNNSNFRVVLHVRLSMVTRF